MQDGLPFDGSISDAENGLNNHELKDDVPDQIVGVIRAKFLACILRLADELDVTVERLGNGDVERQLNSLKEKKMALEGELYGNGNLAQGQRDEEKIKKIEGYIESLTHWDKLHLFSRVHRINEESDEIRLVINDDYIKRRVDAGDTCEKLADDVLSVNRKIEKELKEGLLGKIEESKNKLALRKLISVNSVALASDIDEMSAMLAKKSNSLNRAASAGGSIKRTEKTEPENGEAEKAADAIVRPQPEVIDGAYQERLGGIIQKKRLIKVGHFLLDETYCARDWIDTKEIVETRGIMDGIVEHMVRHINTRFKDERECLILGLDLEGAILASRVGMAMQKPFSYLIPAKEVENNAGKDVEAAVGQFDKYIIITDAIVTYETIRKVLDTLDKNGDCERILQIYTIFYRESLKEPGEEEGRLIKKTACISKEFGAELFRKEDCPYAKKSCFGANRKMI